LGVAKSTSEHVGHFGKAEEIFDELVPLPVFFFWEEFCDGDLNREMPLKEKLHYKIIYAV